MQNSEVLSYIQRAKKGDQKAFSSLLHLYWNDVYGFQLLRTRNENDAEDITIRTFSRAFDKIDSFDESYEFKTWLIAISKNIHIDLLRKQKSKGWYKPSDKEEDELYEVADETPSAEDELIRKQHLENLLRYLKQLKPQYQEVLNLRYFQEMSYEEISSHLQEPLNNVKVKLLRAKRLLAEIIQHNKRELR